MQSTLKVRGEVPRVSSGRTGTAIPLQQACQDAGVELEVGRKAIRTMRVFSLPDASGAWLVSPAAVAVLARMGGRRQEVTA
jgi:hypothetical protein